MNHLAGKVVAITGGGTGIGAGIAKGLAVEGCKVTVGGRRAEPLETLGGMAPDGSSLLEAQDEEYLGSSTSSVMATLDVSSGASAS